ncbi:Hypothetical protein MYA_0309 [Burkholderia sp. KJ006]|nr:Hypothetical protein MYA_0309 [Burkholderia sp. KJ006]
MHRHTGKQSRDYSCPVRPVLTRRAPAAKRPIAVSPTQCPRARLAPQLAVRPTVGRARRSAESVLGNAAWAATIAGGWDGWTMGGALRAGQAPFDGDRRRG